MRSVNFRIVAALALAGCSTPFSYAPPMPAAPPPGQVPADATVVWREGVGRGLIQAVAVAGPVIVAVTTDRAIVTLSSESGERYWRLRVGAPVFGPAVHAGDRLYVATGRRDEHVYAIDAERGRRIWATRVGPAVATPTLAGDTLYIATSRGLAALRTADGSVIFERRLSGSPTAGPVVRGEDVWVGTTADTLFALSRGTGAIRRGIALASTLSAAPLLAGDVLYAPTHGGHLIVLDLTAGRVLRSLDLGAPILASPAAGPGGDVFALTRAADVWRIPRDGPPVRIAQLGGAATGSLTVAGARLVVGKLDGSVLALDREGTILWSRDVGDSVLAPVAIAGDAVFVPLLRGTLVKLQ